MTFDEELDGFDPVIAEKFQLLDRVTPVDLPQLGGEVEQQVVANVDQPIVLESRRNPVIETASRSRYLLAAAAAVVTVAGVSVLALANINNDANLQAGNNGGQSEVAVQAPQADDADDEERSNRSLTVEGSTTIATTVPAETPTQDSSTTESAGETQTATEATVAENPAENDANATETGSATPTTSGTTTPPTSASTAPPETPVPTTMAITIDTSELTPDRSWLNPPTAEKMISVRGTVMEVFTDCQSRLILNESNEVESVGPVSCDGGSYIVVDGTRIMTASGYMMSEADMYGKHLSTLRPGQQVTVTAVPTASAGGMLTLNCVLCQIKLG